MYPPTTSNSNPYAYKTYSIHEKDDSPLTPIYKANPDGPPYIVQADILFAWSSFKSHKNDHHDIPCALILTAPDQPISLRCGVDIICVIDVSGSMEEDRKLILVKRTLNFMISQLNELDRICIISFNDHAKKLMPLIIMNNQGKAFAATVVNSLTPCGGTNIVEGLEFALTVALNRTMVNYTLDVLILSDGVDSHQESSIYRARACFELFESKNISYSVHAFGYGHHHDSHLLGDIAHIKNGGFYYIEEPEDICHAFSHSLGEILSVVSRDIKVSLVLLPCPIPFSLSKVHSECGTVNFRLPNLSSGTTKEAVFELSFPPCLIQLTNCVISPLKAYITFIMVSTGEIITLERDLSIEIRNNNSRIELFKGVMIHFFRVRTAEVMRIAGELGLQHRFNEARGMVEGAIKTLKKCEYHNDAIIKALIHDLEICKHKLRDRGAWDRGGHAHFRHIHHGHWAKRAERHDVYQNAQQKNLRLQSINYF